MLCQNCQVRPANVHLTQVVNGEKTELFLCEKCAERQSQIGFSLNSFLTGLLGGSPEQFSRMQEPDQPACNKCGLTFERFRQEGKIGCAGCYDAFYDRLSPIIKHMHGNLRHVGKIPGYAASKIKNAKEIENLRLQLEQAVKNEKYEEAARLRDRIKELESPGN